ncbi:hypothetical protein [Paraconexibacter sp.]|uniref:hypothetical protein n=1 Tax=Paraconexibacter sp. TaxID=2949640 RepID=UPI003565A826
MRRPYVVLLTVVGSLVGAFAAFVLGASRILNRERRLGDTLIGRPYDRTEIAPSGAVRSVQGADVTLTDEDFQRLWNPTNLERLARSYWAFLTRVSLGLIRVEYTEGERHVVFIRSPLVLLSFHAPDYEMDTNRGIVRWRIKQGLLVAPSGREGDGYLEIDVQRLPSVSPGKSCLHVDVEVANFYPAIASSLSRFLYTNTQSRIHVIVTHGFLRSLVHGKLSESVVGRFAVPQTAEETPDPVPARERSSLA